MWDVGVWDTAVWGETPAATGSEQLPASAQQVANIMKTEFVYALDDIMLAHYHQNLIYLRSVFGDAEMCLISISSRDGI